MQRRNFHHPTGEALSVDGIKVASSVFLNKGFSATGTVNLNRATVGGDLTCATATFAQGSILGAERARISGGFWWMRITDGTENTQRNHKAPYVALDLDGASAASLTDDENSWPAIRKLFLDGFTYDRLGVAPVPRKAESRLRWLRLQNRTGGVATQPYEQLAAVLEKSGDEPGARQVRIAMEDDLRADLPWYWQIWPSILKLTIGYGYESWLALCWALGFVMLGCLCSPLAIVLE